jgi:hypothetical protein
MNPVCLILVSAIVWAGPQQAPRVDAPAAAGPQTDGNSAAADEHGDLPVSVGRVQHALSHPPAIDLRRDGSVFRVEVLGTRMSIEDILGPDYLKGPVPRAGMTHQEFLDMVTPKDYQGYAPYTNGEAMTIAATSFALKWALQKAIHKYENAKQDRERDAARKEVQDALAELEKARLKAGLPPR